MTDTPRIGTAGWSIPRIAAELFPREGPCLQRYAARLNCAEINSSFYRAHRPASWARWAASVPEDFAFSVKAPRELTHARKLADPAAPLAAFADEVAALGDKLGALLLQLPPSLAFEPEVARTFLMHWRARLDAATVLEPRHASWFEPPADALLIDFAVARVAADPALSPAAARPGGWRGLRYWRLHGSPRMYSSSYDPEHLDRLAAEIAAQDTPAWCVFDNTMHGAAAANALELAGRVGSPPYRPAAAS